MFLHQPCQPELPFSFLPDMGDRPPKCRRLFIRSGIPHAKLVKLMAELAKEEDLRNAIQISRHDLHKEWDADTNTDTDKLCSKKQKR